MNADKEMHMTHEEKIQWMAMWCAKNKATLNLEGECGFGRECVGILLETNYPDYEWWDEKTYERIDPNGDVWTPADAYHKHPCVAVLGRGEEAEAQLYEWLKWFDDNGFKAEVNNLEGDDLRDVMKEAGPLAFLMGKHKTFRMVRTQPVQQVA